MIVRLSLSGEILLFCFFIKFAENQCCYGTNEVLSCGNLEGCVKLKKESPDGEKSHKSKTN